ncbi:zonadhesin, partial [Biomphalaria pfeifferi]
LTTELMYCYQDDVCNGQLVSSQVMNISNCCTEGFAGSWGSQMSTYGCTPCKI